MAGAGFTLRVSPPLPSVEAARAVRAELVGLVDSWLRWTLTSPASEALRRDYLPEARSYAAKHYDAQDTRPDGLTFTFPDFTGLCHIEQGLALHWHELTLALFAETIDLYVLRPLGAALAPARPVDQLLLRAERSPVVVLRERHFGLEWPEGAPAKDAVVLRATNDERGLTLGQLDAAERAQVELVRRTGLCGCEACRLLREYRRDSVGQPTVFIDPKYDDAHVAAEALLATDPARAARAFALARTHFLPSPPPSYALRLACAHARAGEPEAALRALRWAVADGLEEVKGLATDPDLAALRDHPGFAALVARGPERPKKTTWIDPLPGLARAVELLATDAAPQAEQARAALAALDPAGWSVVLHRPPPAVKTLLDALAARGAKLTSDALVGLLQRA